MVLSDLGRDPGTRDRAVRRRVRVVRPELRPVAERPERPRGRRVRQRPALRRARRHSHTGPDDHARRRRRRRAGRPRRRHQSSPLAATLRRRQRRRRAPAHRAARAVHHRRRDAARVLRSGRRPDDGRDAALRRRAAHSRPGEPVGKRGLVVAADHGAPEAGAEPRAGQRRAPSRRSRRSSRAQHVGSQSCQRTAHAGTGRHRQLVAAQALRDAALRDGRGRGARAARRVRQHRQPAARAGAGATPRAQRAPGAGELTLADRAAALHRESDRGRDRCGVRAGVREVEQCAPRAAVEHVAEHRVAGPRTRLARARVHGGSCVSLGDHRWRGPRARAEERHPGRGAQGRGPRDCGRPPLCRAQHARRRPDCRVTRPGRRGRTVPAHVCVAQPVAARLRARAAARRGVEPPGERRAARGARCARRAPARRGGGGPRRAFGIRLRDTAPHRRRLVNRPGRRRRWADGPPEVHGRPVALAERHDTRLVRDDGHASAQRPGLRRPATAWAAALLPS